MIIKKIGNETFAFDIDNKVLHIVDYDFDDESNLSESTISIFVNQDCIGIRGINTGVTLLPPTQRGI